MSAAATALQFPAFDSADADSAAEWSEEQEELAATAAIDHKARRIEALKAGLRIGQPDGTPTSLSALKAEVAMVVAGGRGAGPAWPTGVGELDAALGGGVPRGRVTEVVGPLGAGKTSLVRQVVARVLSEGGWVAWVDATRTLAPADLAGLGERLIMVRPHDHTRGAWCADLLLRSGVFALVVLDGAPVLSRTVGVRLSQLARERDAAFVVMREGTQSSRLGGAVRLQLRPLKHAQSATSHATISHAATSHAATSHAATSHAATSHANSTPVIRALHAMTNKVIAGKAMSKMSMSNMSNMSMTNTTRVSATAPASRPTDSRKFSVLVEKGGSYRTVEVTCAIVVARRVCADTEIPDRRGVARGARAAGGVEQEHAHEQSAVESIAEQPVSAAEPFHINPTFASPTSGSDRGYGSGHSSGHAVDAGAAGQFTDRRVADRQFADRQPASDSWKKGRGRPRMAESSYGRVTRRGKARTFLSNREHAQNHDGDYQRKQSSSESASGKHTQQPNHQQERRESRRQSRHALKQYAGSLG